MGTTNMGIDVYMRFSPRRQTAGLCRGTWLALAVAVFALAGSVEAQPCVVPDNGGGTVNLPPEGCGYLSPTDLHMIIDGLPVTIPPTTITVAVEHERFFCKTCVGGPLNGQQCDTPVDCLGFPCQIDIPLCSTIQPTDICDSPGGSLGGEAECSESTLTLNMTGTGALAGFNRLIPLRAEFETHVAPRTPGDPVQSFDTDMFRLFGQITNPGSGDPDFDLLRIVAGTDFGLPSPGHTTLTLLPGGGWNVDSFFDITYRIDFVGRPGGALGGMSGSTTGTIRMQTGLGVGTCAPNSTLSACIPTQCPDPAEACQPRCTKVDPLTGQTLVVECDCRGPNDCHAYNTNLPAGGLAARGTPGNPCTQIDNGSGTVTLPPAGCEYLSPDEVHKIIDGLPAGTTIELGTIHKDFICHQQGTINPVCTFSTLVDCDQPGGSLGGEQECVDSTLALNLNGTGTLAGFNRQIDLPIGFETHTAPRTPGNPVQSFDTDMFRLFGQITNPGSGDPDFDLLRIVAGTDFGLPSPGHTTLVQLPGGNWAVDSFFDITYRIDFVGRPGGALSGMSGSTTGTIRMQTGTPSRCVGGCPPGFTCKEDRVVNADGTITVCCDCVPPPPPPPDPHRSLQGTSISFGALDTPAIPADFFGPGSLPFLGSVNFLGGPTDTLIQRSGAMVCPLPPPAPCDPLQTEIVALDLVSVAPINVGGPPPNQWNVEVGLSVNPQPQGTLDAFKQHPNGGVFNAEIRVLPKLVFREVGNPNNFRTLDYGLIGQPPVRINFLNAFWVVNLGPNLVGTILAPNDGNFVPGVFEQIPGNPNTQVVIQATGNSKGGGVSHPVDPVPVCPLPDGPTDPCAQFQARDCRNPSLGDVCVPTIIRQLPGGAPELIACGCRPAGGCHVTFGPIPGAPICVGGCPTPTETCDQFVNAASEYSCDCVPLVCEPNATQTGCNPSACPIPGEECQPRCAHANPATGEISVTGCDCGSPAECHLTGNFTGGAFVSWRGGGGAPCVVPDNGGGTVTLPPEGCDYLSPDDVHEILNGLPGGTTVQVGAIHGGFLCEGCLGGPNDGHPCTTNADCPGGQCRAKVDLCSFPVQLNCDQAGGSLGGEIECNDSTLDLMMQGTGTLGGYSRNIPLRIEMETHTGPRTAGNPVQSFDTDMFRLFGEITNPGSGDPDFDLLRITGGTNFGLPSPGHTTLTQLPGGSWAVDSFFDIEYRIDFVGRPGGPFSGMSGSTTGTIRMATGTPTKCQGICPVGTTCVETRTVNADGTIDVCCDCVNVPPPPDPLTKGTDDVCVGGVNAGQPCAQNSDCPGGFCRLKNRFITAEIPATATAHGLKVNIVGLDANSVATPGDYNGTDRWAGLPSIGVNDGISPPFNAAKTQCAFQSTNWSAVGRLHMYGDVVVPQSVYDVSNCSNAATCSAALRIGTAKWGDVVSPVNTVNFQDVNSIVAKFQGQPGAPSKTRADLVGRDLNPPNPINFQDVSACVSAFQSKPYKQIVALPPLTCP